MPNDPNPSPISKLRKVRRGLGEIVGFAVASLSAVVEILSGRWVEGPDSRRRRRTALKSPEETIDRVAPYPVQDG
jgi:hypothetical protein